MKTFLIAVEQVYSRSIFVRAENLQEAKEAVEGALGGVINLSDRFGEEPETRILADQFPQDWEEAPPTHRVNEDGELEEVDEQ